MKHIQRQDHDWLPFWHPSHIQDGALVEDRRHWTVGLRYRTPTGQMAFGPARYSRWRLGALWNALRGRLQHP